MLRHMIKGFATFPLQNAFNKSYGHTIIFFAQFYNRFQIKESLYQFAL